MTHAFGPPLAFGLGVAAADWRWAVIFGAWSVVLGYLHYRYIGVIAAASYARGQLDSVRDGLDSVRKELAG